MKMRIANTVLLCLLFAAFAFASPRQQDEPKGKEASPAMQHPESKPEAKPETQEQKPEEMKPEKNEQENKENKDAKQEEKENRDRDKVQEKQEQKEDKKSDKDKNKEMGNMRDENRGNAHPAGKGGHIPDDKFRAHFGRGHSFHVSKPVIVNNQPTFSYGGYSFIMVDPWPVGWAYTDDCYVDYVDGEYFLFDVLHPGVRIALSVSM